MKQLGFATLALAGVVSLTACMDQSAQPLGPQGADLSTSSAGARQHLVLFTGNSIPADFAARVAALGGTVETTLPQVGVAYVSGLDATGVSGLRGSSGVQAIEPEVSFTLMKPVAQAELESVTNPASSIWYALQWNMKQIGANKAWTAGKLGSAAVKVAIIDTGLDYTHYDLAGKVDLARSKSFLPSEDAVIAQYLPGMNPVFDLHGHGTHVGATVSSNGVVAAGVTSRVTLMGLKVCRSDIEGLTESGCPSSATFAALLYAADNGADVVNMSLGGLFTKRGEGGIGAINRVFNYMKSKRVTVVVAAGNDGADIQHNLVPVEDEDGKTVIGHYPSLYASYCDAPNVICVSATGPTKFSTPGSIFYGPWEEIDAPAVYTNFGNSITVAAPGGNVGGYIWAACPRRAITKTGDVFAGGVDAYCNGGYPAGMAGTSMAAPHVAGLAALMVEKYGKNPADVSAAIRDAADDLGKEGSDPFYGKGRINVARALGLN